MTDMPDHTPDEETFLRSLRQVPAPRPPADLPARFHARAALERPAPVAHRRARHLLMLAAGAAIVFVAGAATEWYRHRSEARALRQELAEARQDLSAARRMVAMINAGASGVRDGEVSRTLSQVALTDPSATVRTAAVEALAQVGDRRTIAALAEAALRRERSPFVLEALVRATDRLDAPDRDLVLRAVLGTPDLDPAVRTEVERRLTS